MAIIYRVQSRRRTRHPKRMTWWGLVILALALAAYVYWNHSIRPGPRSSPIPRPTNVIHRPLAARSTQSTNPVPAFVPIGQTLAPPPTNRTSAIQAMSKEPLFDRVLRAQIAMSRRGISAGSLDGMLGSQTRAALCAFQEQEHIPVTGQLDARTWGRLYDASEALYTNYLLTAEDLGRLQPLGDTWLAKSQQSRLDFETVLELVAERSQSNPKLIRTLNPSTAWTNVAAGTTLRLPRPEFPAVTGKAGYIKLYLAQRTLQVFDESTNLLAHFPCSIAQRVDKRPVGQLHVASIALNPNYTFDPGVFPESAEARELGRKLILQPGPNNPVGTAWIGLDRPGYGIHGTPLPEHVGRTESHGCFRLANWNATYLASLVWVGLPVLVE